ncbi:MAG TPA: D-alanyl-D-alanine carboxypeptidase/D-alanyl-D-alanine-endopeptidase [Streptosporangiaceae bacterium]|jgi:D-alanyl-D-alanine carboxypeptidase/D-alanyl-D-alanine-endopeptidase (penicillin-binding protein 4)
MFRTSLITATVVLAAGVTAAGSATTSRPAAAGLAARPAVTSPLQAAWQSVLAEPQIQHALIGGYAYDVTTGRTLASVHPDWRLTPGSVTKLYATAASLADWGNRFGLVTRVAQAHPGGPVYLVGAGSVFGASFSTPTGDTQLEGIAKAVAAKVHRASSVVGVSTLFGGWTAGPAWDVSEVGGWGDPAVSALTADRGNLEVSVAAGPHAGSRPAVTLDPGDPALVPPGFFKVRNDAVTGPARSHGSLYVRCLPGTDTIVVSGSKPAGSKPTTAFLAIGNPALFTAALFQHYLTADGVKLARPASTGTLPGGTRQVYAYRSPLTLTKYITAQNSWSVNQMAESLYRLLGVARHGRGTPQNAAAAVRAFLARAHLSQARVQVDGSGLSILDEMSPAQVTGMLSYIAHQRYFTAFEHSLIHIGKTSQCTFMCGFMDGTAADGHVWLKTGNLANQWNYAGYAHARNGDLIAFTLFFDGLQGDNAFNEAIGPIDKMTVDVARWPDEPQTADAARAAGSTAGSSGGGGLPASVTALLPPGAAAAARVGYAPGDVISASVVNTATGKVAAQANGQTELQGGLLARLATVATALRHGRQLALAGPEVQATGKVSGGQLHGDLILNGRDDPLAGRQQLTALARSLARRGVRSVTGRLEYVAGGGGFGYHADGVAHLPFNTPDEDVGAFFSPPAGPLVVGRDQVKLMVRGAARPGHAATVTVEPAGSPVRITGSITTATGSSGTRPAAVWQPGPQAYRLSGSVAPGQRATLPVAPPYPALVAADWFLAALHSAGIAVHGTPAALATDPGGRALASQPAPALAAEAQQALTTPSNVAPYGLLQQLGPHAKADIAALTSPADQIIDPSGNAADDYLTAGSISGMLAAVHADPAEAPLVSLLRQPWIVRLPERTTLAGYTTGPGGEPLAYTIIINGQLYNPSPDLPSRYQPQFSR